MTKVIGVRFRTAGKIYFFSPGKFEVKRGDQVIVETARGVEFGNVVMGPKKVKDEDGQIDISWINEDLITFVKDRLGHDQRYAIDPAKITAALGWYPETKFEDGIVKTIEWYLNNQDWVEEVTSGDYQHYYEKMYGKR